MAAPEEDSLIDETASGRRCLLVTGVPYLDARVGQARILRQLLKVSAERVGLDNPRINVSVNVHGRVLETATLLTHCPVPPEVIRELTAEARESTSGVEKGLKFSFGAGRLRDHHFPSLPFELRREVQMDAEATYSVTSELLAMRTAKIAMVLLDPPCGNETCPSKKSLFACRILDGMACVGGNTLAFSRFVKETVAVEICNTRYGSLRKNFSLFRQAYHLGDVEFVNGCFCESLMADRSLFDVIFLDPPWGGSDYAKVLQENQGDIPCAVGCWNSVSQLVLGVSKLRRAKLVMAKLPVGFEIRKLIIDPLVNDPHLGMERDFPFLFNMGVGCRLLILVANRFLTENSAPHFCNAGLDQMVEDIMAWHVGTHNVFEEGCREHKPQFYDFEKNRWICLKKWKGSKCSATKSDP